RVCSRGRAVRTMRVTWVCFFFSSRRRHTRSKRDWSSDVCSSDLQSLTHLRDLRSVGNIHHFGRKGILLLSERLIKTCNFRSRLNKRQRRGVADTFPRASYPAIFTAEIHYFTSRESSFHQASMVGFFASMTKSISPCTLRQRAASAIIRTESRP